jgi:hypothetical protein
MIQKPLQVSEKWGPTQKQSAPFSSPTFISNLMAFWAATHIVDVKCNFNPLESGGPRLEPCSLKTQERRKRKRTAGLVRSGMPIEKDFPFEMEPAWLKLPG